jgi:hypothetical protein
MADGTEPRRGLAVARFPNPCPLCGADDEHAAWAGDPGGFQGATFCPHPREPGHGTGCCCAGRSKPWTAGLLPPMATRTIFRDLSLEELNTAGDELRRRITALTDSGISRREAELRVITGAEPIVEGEPVADTALRFAILPASLEDRVAALEECIRYPLRSFVSSWTPLTEAQEAEVKESIAEAARIGPLPCTGHGNADLYRAGRGLRPFDLSPLTEEQEAELRRAFDATMQAPAAHHVIQPGLSPDEIRQILRECVTVVKPGEVLIFRCPEGWTPIQVAEVGQCAAQWLEDNAPEVKMLVMPDAEMAVMEPGADGGFDRHVAEALTRLRQRGMMADGA